MVPQSEVDYWRVREAEERLAVKAATCVEAADCHRVMAERYADRIWSAEEAVPEIDDGAQAAG